MEDVARTALAAGTPADVIELVKGTAFLTKCLAKAKFSADLLQDSLDACDINELDALVLGSGVLSVTEASEKLFLMQDEANTVVTICRRECLRAGVLFGDGAKLTPAELAEMDKEDVALPAQSPSGPAHPAVHVSGHASLQRHSPGKPENPLHKHPEPATSAPTASTSAPAAPAAPAPPAAPVAGPAPTPAAAPAAAPPATPPAAAAPVASTSAAATPAATAPAASTSSDPAHPDPNFLIKPPVQASAPAAALVEAKSLPSAEMKTPASARGSGIPRPASARTPATPTAATPTPRERPAAKPATRASPSTTTPLTVSQSAREPQAMRTTYVSPSMNGKHTPLAASTAFGSSTSNRPPRPGSAPLTTRSSAPLPTPVDKPKRPESAIPTPSTPATLPSYARPTAAAKARVSNKDESDLPSSSSPSAPPVTFASTTKPMRRFPFLGSATRASTTTPVMIDEKKELKKPVFDNIRSSLLKPTQAFLAWTQGKSKKEREERDLKASQGLTASDLRPKSGIPRSSTARQSDFTSGGSATTTPQPFKLSGMDRHQKAQEELAKKREEKERAELAVPKFKASPAPSTSTKGTSTSPLRGAGSVTQQAATPESK